MKQTNMVYTILIVLYFIINYFWLIFFTNILYGEFQIYNYILLALFHIFFFMLIWSMISTTSTDPGLPPVFWVLLIGILHE